MGLNIFIFLLVAGWIYLLASIILKDSGIFKFYALQCIFIGGCVAFIAILPILLVFR